MNEFLGPIRLFSSDERCALLSEVSARSKYGEQVAEKVRRFCSYHRSNIGSVAFERFGSESNDMIIWMYQVLNVYLSRSEISKGLSFDPAFVNAIFHLVDAIKILGRHRSSVKAYVDQLLLDLSAVEYGNDVFTSDNFNLNGWIVEAKHAKKIIIFCPNP